MGIELTKQELTVETEKEIVVYYQGEEVCRHSCKLRQEEKINFIRVELE